MEFINTVAGVLGISGTELLIIAGLVIVLVVVWGVIRAVIKTALHIFALGCVTILGIALGLWVLFVILK